jgi:hypothetical protein
MTESRDACPAWRRSNQGTGIPENEDTISSIILGTSTVTARGIPVADEYIEIR